MEIGLHQNLALTQQLIMTPQLQQAIKLLQLSRLELAQMIRNEMEENPALEDSSMEDISENDGASSDNEPDNDIAEPDLQEVTIEEKINTDTDWDNYINEYNSTGRAYLESETAEAFNLEAFTSKKKTLKEHLQWQLMLHELSLEEEKTGHVIIGNIDKDGYLRSDVDEILKISGSKPELIKKIIGVIQTFDPPGVCARNLAETLLIQTKQLNIDNPIITKIINNHLKDLENKNTKRITAALKISLEDFRAAVKIIQYLEPKPGRKFSTEEPSYIIPDIFVYKNEDSFQIVMNDDGLPKLRVSNFYKKILARKDKISKDAKDYLSVKMQAASWLIKSIHQRQKTIYRVMESILKFQKEFFEKGIIYLRPLVLRDVAEDIEMHESTISRVTTNKYAFTPQGLFELKYFFNSSIDRIGAESISSASVKEKIRIMIDKENPDMPLSDEKIASLLQASNIQIARRTIAKYRKVLKILPSNKRKKL